MKKSCSKNSQAIKRLTIYLKDGRVVSGVYPAREAASRIALAQSTSVYQNHLLRNV